MFKWLHRLSVSVFCKRTGCCRFSFIVSSENCSGFWEASFSSSLRAFQFFQGHILSHLLPFRSITIHVSRYFVLRSACAWLALPALLVASFCCWSLYLFTFQSEGMFLQWKSWLYSRIRPGSQSAARCARRFSKNIWAQTASILHGL